MSLLQVQLRFVDASVAVGEGTPDVGMPAAAVLGTSCVAVAANAAAVVVPGNNSLVAVAGNNLVAAIAVVVGCNNRCCSTADRCIPAKFVAVVE